MKGNNITMPIETGDLTMDLLHCVINVSRNKRGQLKFVLLDVFKTLVLRGERCGLFVCVVPGDAEVDLKKAARAIGDKKADLIAVRELLPLTGYIRGGCSPIGMKKALPTLIHSTVTDFDTVYVSAGIRGLQLCLAPAALVSASAATITDLIKE